MSAPPVEKMLYVGKRNPNLPAVDFAARWKQHAVLSSTVATVADAVLGMAQCSRVLDSDVLPGASKAYDGVSIMRVSDPQRIFESQKEKQHVELLLPDELIVFTDYVANSTVVAHERLIHTKPIERAKHKRVVIDIVTRGAGSSPAEFATRWHAVGDAIAALPGFSDRVLRFAQNSVYGRTPPGHPYDGISELWFETEDDVAQFLSKATRSLINRELASFIDMERRATILTWVSHAFFRPGVLAG